MPVDFSLYLITDRRTLPAGRSLEDAVAAALDGGLKAVQLREKDLSDAQIAPIAERLRRRTADYGAKLLINDRSALAQKIGADGVHLGRHSRPVAEVRQELGPTMLIGLSTHAFSEISTAVLQGADFVTYGPVFETPSKSGMGSPTGLDRLRQACQIAKIPVFALGGIDLQAVKAVLDCGASGIGLIRAIQDAPCPTAATQKLLCQLETASTHL